MATSGRPRDLTVDARVLDATAQLLAESGYAGLRIDDIAALSGVAKTTVYRRWPSLVHVTVDAMAHLLGDRRIPARTGDVEADLRAAGRIWLGALSRAGTALPALALDIHRQDDAELRALYREHLIDPVRGTLIAIIADAQDDGSLRRDADPAAAADALIGAAMYRLTVLHESVGDADLEAILPIVLDGLRA